MTEAALASWTRATRRLEVARSVLSIDPDGAASAAYYAAFYAVTALFELDEKVFRRHSAIEAAVHRELVKTGRWTVELGRAFSRLAELRLIGDYGGARCVTEVQAREAINEAEKIVKAVADVSPLFRQ
jgi:uncharacterized protein (UPF0332 family)